MISMFRAGMQPGMFGPQMGNASTPQNNEGLGLPGGQAIFNLPRTGNVPGTTVNFPSGQVGGQGGSPGLKFSITRTASSDPVQNIINDISNPMSGANIDIAQTGATPAQPRRSLSSQPGSQPGVFANDFYPTSVSGPPNFPIGVPNFQNMWEQQGRNSFPQLPQFGLRGRMTQQQRQPPMGQDIFL